MPLLETKGAGSAQGFGLSLGGEEAVYIEDVFSTYLYTGTGASLSIVNGIDLSTEGGLVWTKSRSDSSFHKWYDSARGISFAIESNTTDANQTEVTGITSFNTNGYTYGTDGNTNSSGTNYASWTFRKQPKFFDIVTYTGNGTAGRTVAHNLGSVPGCMIVKRTDQVTNWEVFHRSLGATKFIWLNSTSGEQTSAARWNDTAPTSTQFTVGNSDNVNASGGTYVAYLFAHDAGGFGLTGTDNVISCGTFTTDGSGVASVSLGYEPQWVMTKNSSGISAWRMFDTMRGMTVAGQNDALLQAQSSSEEFINSDYCSPNATGFAINGHEGSATFIYIAIRRGPMKVPTSGTSVYKPIARTGTGAVAAVTGVGFAPDAAIVGGRNLASGHVFFDKLRGPRRYVMSINTSSENTGVNSLTSYDMDGVTLGADTAGDVNLAGGYNYINHLFQRAPGFFDVVCDTGTGAAHTITHNLGVVPELMIRKKRSALDNWIVYANNDPTDYLILNTTDATADLDTMWNDTAPTSTVFTVGTNDDVNQNTGTFVTYLFSTAAGVSKVGSYTGTGTTLQINCGFTGGARFVMIKRTDSTGGWHVWDSARGIVAGNDPYLLLNSSAAEVTNTDYVDTYSAGFEISSTAPAAINASAGTFIFLAIA